MVAAHLKPGSVLASSFNATSHLITVISLLTDARLFLHAALSPQAFYLRTCKGRDIPPNINYCRKNLLQ